MLDRVAGARDGGVGDEVGAEGLSVPQTLRLKEIGKASARAHTHIHTIEEQIVWSGRCGRTGVVVVDVLVCVVRGRRRFRRRRESST